MNTSAPQMAAEFLEFDDILIFEQIGQRAAAASEFPAIAVVPADALKAEYPDLGFGDDAVALGKRVAKRLLKELHDVVCGDEDDDVEDREKIKAAIGISDTAVAAAVAAVLAGPLGVGGAIAGAVAALFVKRFVRPGVDEMCKAWDESLDATLT